MITKKGRLVTGWVEGKNYRKPWSLAWNIGASCQISLQSIVNPMMIYQELGLYLWLDIHVSSQSIGLDLLYLWFPMIYPHNYGKSPFFICKSTNSMAMVRKLLVYLWGTFHPSLKWTKAALRVTVTKEMGPWNFHTGTRMMIIKHHKT